jgi:type I restriction enzyme R subunit
LEQLEKTIDEVTAFCAGLGVDLDAIQATEGFERIARREEAVDRLLSSDDTKRNYLLFAETVDRLFRAVLPDVAANRFAAARQLISVLAQEICSYQPPADISGVMGKVGDVLDRSVAADPYVIKHPAGSHLVDLSLIDFDALKQQFERGRKRIEIEKLRGSINAKLQRLVRLNRMRMDFYEQFQRMIEEYNSGSANEDAFFAQLVAFSRKLNEEEKRHISEQLDEEELAIFDLLTRPEMNLTKKGREAVKRIAKDLLDTLKAEKLVLDWRKKQATRAAVRLTVEEELDRLPESYTPEIYQKKCEAVYEHIYDSYFGVGRSTYSVAA